MAVHVAHREIAAQLVARDFHKTLLHDDSRQPVEGDMNRPLKHTVAARAR